MKTNTLNSPEGLKGFSETFSIFSFIEKNGKKAKPFGTLRAENQIQFEFEPQQSDNGDHLRQTALPAPEPAATTKPKKRQVSCRAFTITRIHAVTRAELCLDRQGPHCGGCELYQTDSTEEVK